MTLNLKLDVEKKMPELLRIAEIGVFSGTTAIHMLSMCDLGGVPLQYHLIDPWLDESREFKDMISYSREFSIENTAEDVYQHVLAEITSKSRVIGMPGYSYVIPMIVPDGFQLDQDTPGIFVHKKVSPKASLSIQTVDITFVD